MSYLDTIRNYSAAIAFAEAGEFNQAKKVAGMESIETKARSGILQYINKVFSAAALAEGGLHKEASEMMDQAPATHGTKERPRFI